MRFRPMPCAAEAHAGTGAGGTLALGDLTAMADALRAQYAGQVQTIYLDPPFCTGKTFVLRQRCGEAGWSTGSPAVNLPAYDDRWPDREALLSLLRQAAELSYDLLGRTGSLFVHIDSRLHARARLLLDDIFGEKQFVNEIVWAYQSGGRSLSHFSRKHDIILYYRKTPGAYFDIRAVGLPRPKTRANHMRRGVDARGRSYRSIVSQGREYRYYDDEPTFPGDVWSDVSHLQQKDPQRTGYEGQKPLKLLERIVLCSSRPGDLVCDLFAGSGTTAVAAARHGRRFLAVDKSPAALAVMRKRLLGHTMRVDAPCAAGAPRLRGEVRPGLGFSEIFLEEYRMEDGLFPLCLEGAEAVEQLSVGYLRADTFHAFANAARSKLSPRLPESLELPVLDGLPAVLTVDVLGRRMVHVLEGENDGQI